MKKKKPIDTQVNNMKRQSTEGEKEVNKYVNRELTSLVSRQIQINPIIFYCPKDQKRLKKTDNILFGGCYGKMCTLICCENRQNFWSVIEQYASTFKIVLSFDSVIQFVGFQSAEICTLVHKNICTRMFSLQHYS